MNKGVLYAIGAYLVWGFLPLYWHALYHVPALEILANRMVWSLGFVLLVLAYRRQWRWLSVVLRQKRTLLIYLLTATVLAVNWGVYIWAVNADHVVETSLGYFINPLISVLMGVLFLQERLRRGQWVAVALAAAGVLYLTLIYGRLPWIALVLAFSFGFYGLIRKQGPLGGLEGLTLETGWLFIPASVAIVYWQSQGMGALGTVDTATTFLLVFTGVATAVPLLWFGMAAKRIPLSTIGILQYIAPTFQFMLGVFWFHEPFDQAQLVGFLLIWAALAIYSGEGYWRYRLLRHA